jgi:glutathione S-transferase
MAAFAERPSGNMPTLILHHHDPSPFAEKIRLVFGIKGLAWCSVQVPMIMPKPDLTALTGGYRKAPVLQIDADIYCDTLLIAQELEARFPDPTLFPRACTGLAYALGSWSDKAFFNPGAALSMGENDAIPKDILDDRFEFFNFMDFDNIDTEMPHCYAQFQAHAQLLENELNHVATPFILGDEPSWIDVLAYFPVWMAANNIPRAKELLEPFPGIGAWSSRMESIGRGRRTEMDAAEAHALARDAEPLPGDGVDRSPFHAFEEGDRVRVTPDDYGFDPVEGNLVTLNTQAITVIREASGVGAVAVHFPRTGYRVEFA